MLAICLLSLITLSLGGCKVVQKKDKYSKKVGKFSFRLSYDKRVFIQGLMHEEIENIFRSEGIKIVSNRWESDIVVESYIKNKNESIFDLNLMFKQITDNTLSKKIFEINFESINKSDIKTILRYLAQKLLSKKK